MTKGFKGNPKRHGLNSKGIPSQKEFAVSNLSVTGIADNKGFFHYNNKNYPSNIEGWSKINDRQEGNNVSIVYNWHNMSIELFRDADWGHTNQMNVIIHDTTKPTMTDRYGEAVEVKYFDSEKEAMDYAKKFIHNKEKSFGYTSPPNILHFPIVSDKDREVIEKKMGEDFYKDEKDPIIHAISDSLSKKGYTVNDIKAIKRVCKHGCTYSAYVLMNDNILYRFHYIDGKYSVMKEDVSDLKLKW